MRFFRTTFIALALLSVPSLSFAQTPNPVNVEGTPESNVSERIEGASRGFLRDGIFGCAAGAYGMPVGTLRAIGGVYVPVNDAAVTANTGYLVYKECVLDGVIVRMREAASGAVVKNVLNWANTSTNGGPVKNQAQYYQEKIDQALLESLKDYRLDAMCAQYRTPVKAAVLQSYYRATRDTASQYSCTQNLTASQLENCFNGNGGLEACGGWQGWFEIFSTPGATPIGALLQKKAESDAVLSTQFQIYRDELNQGNGFAPTVLYTSNPSATGENRTDRQILTPGYLISQLVTQAAGSGFRQLENANEIDQIVNSLFSGITQQILTSSGGLSGLSQSVLGKPPYLDQLAAEASAGVRTAAANAALTILNSSISTERTFNTAKRSSKSKVEDAMAKLKAAEDRCFQLLIPKVQEYARTAACSSSADDGTVCDDPKELAISTSTPIIEGGLVALSMATSSTVVQNSVYTLTISPSSVFQTGQAQFTGASTTQFTQSASFGLNLGSAAAPNAGGNASVTIQAKTPFGSGTFSFTLKSGQQLPIGELRIPLLTITPFTQAAVSLTVGAKRQFSEVVIASQLTPLLNTINADIADSDTALTSLLQLANSINNTASQTAQRIALEQLDQLVAQNILHTEYDARDAAGQSEVIGSQMDTLIEDTVNDWGTGSGWCNSENEDVVRMWYDRWKVN